MQKRPSKHAVWKSAAQGLALSTAVYLGGILLLALLQMRGFVPENWTLWLLAVLCLASGFSGGRFCVRRLPLGTLPAALSGAGLFAVALAAAGSCWTGINWAGEGGGLLACVVAGGMAAGLLGRRKPRRNHGHTSVGHM